MAILNRFSAILLYCDSTHLLLLVAENLAILSRDSGNRAFRDSRFCASKVLRPNLQQDHSRMEEKVARRWRRDPQPSTGPPDPLV